MGAETKQIALPKARCAAVVKASGEIPEHGCIFDARPGSLYCGRHGSGRARAANMTIEVPHGR